MRRRCRGCSPNPGCLAYRGIIPHLHLDSMVRQRTPEWWRSAVQSGDSTLVLEHDGKVVGYATLGASRQRGPFQGEIYELYLDPMCQGLGLGEHLFEGCRHALDMRKLRGLIVWALLDNTPACDFYWRRGGRPVTSAFTKIGGGANSRRSHSPGADGLGSFDLACATWRRCYTPAPAARGLPWTR